MASLQTLVDVEEVRGMIQRGLSHLQISSHLKELFPDKRGIIERSVRRYFKRNRITIITDHELEEIFGNLINRFGHGYGRSLMQGSDRAIVGSTVRVVSQRRVSETLRRLAPIPFEERTRDLLQRTNPIPYLALYFGYKVHMDQNEKTSQRYG